jgi:hypothetical protein
MASNLMIARIALVAVLVSAAPVLAADQPRPGFEIGVRTGYAFSAGHLGAPPNGTDNNLGDYVGEDLAKKSLHEWILIGLRFAFAP